MPTNKRSTNTAHDADRGTSNNDVSTRSSSRRRQTSEQAQSSLTKTSSNSIWDWEVPSPLRTIDPTRPDGDKFAEYEQLGVLRRDSRRDNQLPNAEFVVPYPVTTGDQSTLTNVEESTPSLSSRPSAAGVKRKSTYDPSTSRDSRQENKRASTILSATTNDQLVSPRDSSGRPRAQSGPSPAMNQTNTALQSSFDDNTASAQRPQSDAAIPNILPPRKVFPIQVSDRMFRLSGASLSSDAPSYFTNFFDSQLRQHDSESVKTLYIDRDPDTFADIALHLQGYHIAPRDGPHFVKLFADAQFFSLPRLTAQLFASTIYIRIGDSEFQIPRDLFNNPGDSPNYFSLGFSTFFTTPADTGQQNPAQRTLIRPPAILPPSVPNKSAKTFADLLHISKGYDVEIRDREHRADLLRDARYFHLKGLEQKLIPHNITYNLARQKGEILIRLEDIRQSGVTFVGDGSPSQASAAPSPATSSSNSSNGYSAPGWIYYQRPYADQEARVLIVEIGSTESVTVSLAPNTTGAARLGRITFYGQTLARITSLFSVIASKMNLSNIHPLGSSMADRGTRAASLPSSPAGVVMGEERVKMRLGADADVIINGRRWIPNGNDSEDEDNGMELDDRPQTAKSISRPSAPPNRKSTDLLTQDGVELVLKRSQWRIRIQAISNNTTYGSGRGSVSGSSAGGVEAIFGAVKIDGFTNERARNAGRSFLN